MARTEHELKCLMLALHPDISIYFMGWQYVNFYKNTAQYLTTCSCPKYIIQQLLEVSMTRMTIEEHKEFHIKLHENLDILLADFLLHTRKYMSKTTVSELFTWSHKQTKNPTEYK